MEHLTIMHIGLASHFTEGMTYQDNMLSEACYQNGYEVVYVADTRQYKNGVLVEGGEEDYYVKDGFRVIRLKYDTVITPYLSSKIQKVSKLKYLLARIQPKIIFFHGIGGREIVTVADYVKNNPQVLLYADSHADFNNTAKNKSAKIFYSLVYGFYIRKALPYIERIFYITEEAKQFLKILYKIDDDKMELLPLGGMVSEDKEREKSREEILSMLNLPAETVLFMHSGKLNKEKRTIELLTMYHKVDDPNSRMIVFGTIGEDIAEDFSKLSEQDRRIIYLGWKSSKEIFQLLSAANMYCQPGSESATLQLAICCGCAIMIYPHISYRGKPFYDKNGYFVRNIEEIEKVFLHIKNCPKCMDQMQQASLKLGKTYLDYQIQARRILYGR